MIEVELNVTPSVPSHPSRKPGKLRVQPSTLQVVFAEGGGARRCAVCKLDREEWEDAYDTVPNIFLKCPKDCQELVCKRCWDQGVQLCPNCGDAVSGSPSEATFTEKLQNPDRVLQVETGAEDLRAPPPCAEPWRGEPAPRPYQTSAFQAAVQENRIIVMPTGTGKTLVEIMLLDHLLRGDTEPWAVVAVNVAALVSQQAREIRAKSTLPDIRVTELSGSAVEWTPEFWRAVRQGQRQVIVGTAEIIRKAVIDHGFLCLDGCCKLMVFDEAHHALKDHPFVKILRKVTGSVTKAPTPRLVGLTACYLHGKMRAPEAKKRQLEECFAGRIWTPKQEEIQPFIPCFTFERQRFDTPLQAMSSSSFLKRAEDDLWTILRDVPEDVRSLVKEHMGKAAGVLDLLGSEGAQFYFSHGILCAVKHQLEHRMKTFSKDGKPRPKLQSKIRDVEQLRQTCQQQKLRHTADPEASISGKARALIARLKELLEEDTKTRCIIFVSEVASAYPLAELLQRHVRRGVRPVSGRKSMSDEVREKNLRQLREGEEGVWCLVATDCMEEGIDIPACSVVVRFDRFHNVKSHVQGTGRCRGLGKGGLVIYFENDPGEEEDQAARVRAIAEAASEELISTGPQADAGRSVHPATGAEINRDNCLPRLNDYLRRASSGRMRLDDAFEPQPPCKIQRCRVPIGPRRDLTVTEEDIPAEAAGWSPRRRFAFATLTKLLERGFLTENHTPCNSPGDPEDFAEAAEPEGSRSHHLRFSPQALDALQAAKGKLLERICKGLKSENRKGALKECADLLSGNVSYQEVPVPGAQGEQGGLFQREVCITGLQEPWHFSPGDPCTRKAEAEQSAAAVALQELQAMLQHEASGSSTEVSAGRPAKTCSTDRAAGAQEAPPGVSEAVGPVEAEPDDAATAREAKDPPTQAIPADQKLETTETAQEPQP